MQCLSEIRASYSKNCPFCSGITLLFRTFNPLSPNSDENEISLYIITTCSNVQVMRIKKVITKDKMS